MEQDPHCYWCGRRVYIHKPEWRKKIPDNAATIDHLRTRFCSERGVWTNTPQTVLSCRKCNQSRCEEEVKLIPIEILWQRSGRKPDTV